MHVQNYCLSLSNRQIWSFSLPSSWWLLYAPCYWTGARQHPNRDHILPLFISSNILPINLLYFETALIFMHNVAHDSVPLNLKNLFCSSNQVHSYNTRFSSAGNYYVNPSRTNVMRNSISRFGPNVWNSLNNNTREFPRKSFKTEVHITLLSFLASEDIYIESPSIIQKLISTSPQWRLILRLFFNVSKLQWWWLFYLLLLFYYLFCTYYIMSCHVFYKRCIIPLLLFKLVMLIL